MREQEEQQDAKNYDEKMYQMVNIADHSGMTALHRITVLMSCSCFSPHHNSLLYVQKCLLQHGADLSRQDGRGRTVLQDAAHCFSLDQNSVRETALRQLLEHMVTTPPSEPSSGAPSYSVFNMRDIRGHTAMHEAVSTIRLGRSERGLSVLLEYGAPLDQVDHEGSTILHDAVRLMVVGDGDDEDDAKELVYRRLGRMILQHMEQHGNLHHALIQDRAGHTALHKAIQYRSDRSIVAVRTFCGNEPWARLFTNAIINSRAETPLHVAVRTDHVESLEFLLQHKADVSIQDASGRTPLTLACEMGHLNAIFVLFMHGQGLGLRMM